MQEREQLKAQEAAIQAAEEARRRRVTVHIDLLGRQVCPIPTLAHTFPASTLERTAFPGADPWCMHAFMAVSISAMKTYSKIHLAHASHHGAMDLHPPASTADHPHGHPQLPRPYVCSCMLLRTSPPHSGQPVALTQQPRLAVLCTICLNMHQHAPSA